MGADEIEKGGGGERGREGRREGGREREREREREGGKENFTSLKLSPLHTSTCFLQPENILLYRKGSLDIKIADFGLSVQVQQGQEMKTLVGTAEYVCKSAYFHVLNEFLYCL